LGLFNRIFAGHKIDEWASCYALVAARTLNQVAADLIICAEEEIARVDLRQGLFGPAAFIQERIAPLVRTVAEPVALEILAEANTALLDLVEAQAVWVRGPEHSEGPEGAFQGAKDVAAAAVPLAAGAATAAALPYAAVVTTTAWLGLATTTAISWPVVVGGGALAGLGLATGLFNAAKLRDRAVVRLRMRVREFIIASLIEGSEQAPSILQQLSAELERTAERAKTT
jgi:hypothetical protein